MGHTVGDGIRAEQGRKRHGYRAQLEQRQMCNCRLGPLAQEHPNEIAVSDAQPRQGVGHPVAELLQFREGIAALLAGLVLSVEGDAGRIAGPPVADVERDVVFSR